MRCQDVGPRLVDRAWGEIPEHDRVAVELHLAGCRACAGRLDDLARLRRLAVPDLGPMLPDALTLRVRSVVASRIRRPSALALGLSGLLAITSVSLLVRGTPVSASHPLLPPLLLLVWTSLYLWLFGVISPDPGGTSPGSVLTSLSGRAVAYGLVAAIGVSLAALWGVMVVNERTRLIPELLMWYGRGSPVLLVAASSLLLVGLGLGLVLQASSRTHILMVVFLYLGVMVPAFAQIGANRAMIADMGVAVGILLMWSLSGAFVGCFLSNLTGRSGRTLLREPESALT